MFQTGRYYDGKTAKAFTVQIQLSDSVIGLKDVETGKTIARWYYHDIRLLEHPVAQTSGKLGTFENPDERLLLENGPDWDEIVAQIPKHGIFSHKISLHWNSLFFYTILGACIIATFLWKGADIFEQTAYLVPSSVEKKLGDYVLSSSGFIDETCDDENGMMAFEKLLSPMMDREHYSVHVSADSMINAFALPGSHIVIFDGLIQNAQSAEELAAIIGHEMGHVDERHPIRALMRQMGFSLSLTLLVGDVGGLQNIGEIAGTLSAMDYSREQELEADLYAVDVMKRANYNPYAIIGFFESISEDEEKVEKYMKYLKYFSTHPETKKRIDVMSDLKAKDKNLYPPALTQSQWADLQNICGNKQ